MDYVKLANHKNNSADYRRAKGLRKESTSGERILWHELRLASKEYNIRFRRQHPINPYIVDFVCLKLKLIIEVDGSSHDNRLEEDRIRDDYLRQLEYEVIHFTNADVVNNRKGVVETVLNRVIERMAMLDVPLP